MLAEDAVTTNVEDGHPDVVAYSDKTDVGRYNSMMCLLVIGLKEI